MVVQEGSCIFLLELAVYSDLLTDAGFMIEDKNEWKEFQGITPLMVDQENGGKGVQIPYTLLPIDTLSDIFSEKTLKIKVRILAFPR